MEERTQVVLGVAAVVLLLLAWPLLFSVETIGFIIGVICLVVAIALIVTIVRGRRAIQE